VTTQPSSITLSFSQLIAKLNAIVVIQKQLITAINQRVSYRELKTMANQGLTDLQAAVAGLQALQATVVAEIATLQAAAGDPDATVETLAQQIITSTAAIQAAIPVPAPAAPAGT
jgi:hypothetical protein